MRRSSALLAHTPVRLSELTFPHDRVHVFRTRLVFIHLDNLLHFAKIDRDGRVDGYVVAYLPDEVVILLLLDGEVVSAVGFAEAGRGVLPLATALRRVREEPERGELVFCDAPLKQIAWMYGSCAAPAIPRPLDPKQPEKLIGELETEHYTGLLEMIVDGRVQYLRWEDGACVDGFFTEDAADKPVVDRVRQLLLPDASGGLPVVAVGQYPLFAKVPVQASPAMLQIYRELFWSIATETERKAPNMGMKRAYRLRDSLATIHGSLTAIGRPLDRDPAEISDTEEQLTFALSDWALQLLEELDVVSPGAAPTVLKEATKEHRFLLQKTGFYTRLPWSVTW